MKKYTLLTLMLCSIISLATAQTTVTANGGSNQSTCCNSPAHTFNLSGSGSCSGDCSGTVGIAWYTSTTPGGTKTFYSSSANTSYAGTLPIYFWFRYSVGVNQVYDMVTLSVAGISCCRYGGVDPKTQTEVSQPDVVKIAPNPVNQTLHLTYLKKSMNNEVELFDEQGRSVYSSTLNADENANVDIDVSTLPKGIYYIMIKNDDKTNAFEKVVLQ